MGISEFPKSVDGRTGHQVHGYRGLRQWHSASHPRGSSRNHDRAAAVLAILPSFS
jgi:hypothetical protein